MEAELHPNLNELMSCGVCWDLQGSPNGFIYSSFSPTFYSCDRLPHLLWKLVLREEPLLGGWSCPKVPIMESFLSLKWSLLSSCPKKKRKPCPPGGKVI